MTQNLQRIDLARTVCFEILARAVCLCAFCLGGFTLSVAQEGAAEELPKTDASGHVGSGEVLEYKWKDGYAYEYDFKVAISFYGDRKTVQGRTTYTPVEDAEQDKLDALLAEVEKQDQKSTGSAFVVTADGVLVTCAHVVRGATEIKAKLKGKTYVAEVVKYDAAHDLALLRIKADGLSPLPIADSDEVELGEDIRVAGYPLSDVLGSGIKVSRGTISGITKKEDNARFQIDARVNPGSSGGPVVDPQCRVVGIASELLTSEGIDSVGFAIPSKQALALLKQEGITVAPTSDGPDAEGTEVAKRVAGAVALLNVQKGADGIGAYPTKALEFGSSWTSPGDNSWAATHLGNNEHGNMVVDLRGEIISSESEETIPGLYATFGEIGIERLPGDGREQWSSSRLVTLRKMEAKISPSGPPGLPRPRIPYPRSRFDRSPYNRPGLRSRYDSGKAEVKVTEIPAREEISYRRLSGSEDGTIKISKKYRFFPLAKEDPDAPKTEVSMEGVIVWDLELGCVRRSEMKGKITAEKDGATISIPIAMTTELRLRTPEELEKERKAREAKAAETRKRVDEIMKAREAAKERKAAIPKTVGGDIGKSTSRRSVLGQEEQSQKGLSKFNPDD